MLVPKPVPEDKFPRFRFSPNSNRADEIAWHEWSTGAFDQAKTEHKPILLSISAVWCHWCHVMDETSFSDERVINLINDQFIPIRVDADRRPDIQSRYLLGGWPTTAILTDNGEVITGGTYIPPDQLLELLARAREFYQENHEALDMQAARRKVRITQSQENEPAAHHKTDKRLVNKIMHSLLTSFDSANGGFGTEPKFPNMPATEFFLRRAYLEDNSELLEMVVLTLDHMAAGEIFDAVWGGFFRYATKRDWSKPHFEKLLGENAGAAIAYLHAYQVSGRLQFRDVAEKTLAYLDRFLADQARGGFAGSQDADDMFYKLSASEREQAKMPYTDPIVYVDQNAVAVSAYIQSFEITGNHDQLDFAVKTTEFLLKHCFSPEYGMAHSYDVDPHFAGWLADQAYMINALIDMYNATGSYKPLDKANELAEISLRTLRADSGAFYDQATGVEPELGALFIKDKPIRENAVMAQNLYRLAYLTGNDGYETIAMDVMGDIDLGEIDPTPSVAEFGLVADELISEPVILTVVGNKDDIGTNTLLRTAWASYVPGKDIRLLDTVRDFETLVKAGFPPERYPVLYPCIGRMCLPPVDTAHEFEAIIADLPGRPK
ncbi:MAG TPA: DUF255 domain-containing protein [Candidatus Aquicultor sp.]|jgi:hypothetical protein